MKKNLDNFLSKFTVVLMGVLAVIIAFKAVDFFVGRGEVKIIPYDNSPIGQRLLDPIVQINSGYFRVEIADTYLERAHGLSGRPSIQPFEGMLFVFDKADKYGFWMNDMKFDLDMIFINDSKVVDVATNRSSAKEKQKDVYRPTEAANLVLEVPAGTADKYHIKVGDTVNYRNLEVVK